MKLINNKKNTYLGQRDISIFYFVPLMIITAIVPLIVYAKYVDLSGTNQGFYWTGQMKCLDFFSYWKSYWLVLLTGISLCLYVFLYIFKKLSFKLELKYYIPMFIYIVAVLLSSVFSIDKQTALNGFFDSYQGMWVLLSYIFLTFLMINYTNSERDYKLFVYMFIFLIIVEGIIGVFQYFGYDLFQTKLGSSLIVPNKIILDGGLSFNFDKYEIYGTMFNTNFVGSFATLMIPISVLYLVVAKSLKCRIISIIAFVLCVFTMIGCNSRAGYLGVFVIAISSVVLLRKYIKKHLKIVIPVIIILIIIALVLSITFGGKFVDRFKSLGQLLQKQESTEQSSSALILESIDTKDNLVSIRSNKLNLNILVEDNKLYFLDETNEKLPMKKNELGNLVADVDNGIYLQVKMSENYPGFSLITPWVHKGSINFLINEGKIYCISNGGRQIDIEEAECFSILEGYEKTLSSRGYIWGRTIPLLKNYIFYGAGADNFIYTFPHNDYITRMNVDINCNSVIDKPHNYYLQVAINTGVVSLLALLAIFAFYIISSIKLLWNCNFDSFEKKLGLACLLSVIGYLFTAICNDQIVSVAPLFYVILGLGISVNIKLNKKEKENV